MPRRAAPHRGLDVHYGDPGDGDGDDAAPGRPSKTQLKQQSSSLQKLGAELAGLTPEQLAGIDMPDPLREALLEFRRTRSHEGQRRQMQYVGKLMRGADEDRLREAVAGIRLGSARDTLALHEAERWRAELVADDAALARWIDLHPGSDAQQLRSLVRAARRESSAAAAAPAGRAPRSGRPWRELFQFIKPHLAAAAKDTGRAGRPDPDDADDT